MFDPCLGDADPYEIKPEYASHKSRKYTLYPVRALTLTTPANPFMRACRQCVHESAWLFRVLCSHAWYR